MQASGKLDLIKKINGNLDYIKDEYEKARLWSSPPDGDVKFESLIDWLSNEDNEYLVQEMIKLAKDLKKV